MIRYFTQDLVGKSFRLPKSWTSLDLKPSSQRLQVLLHHGDFDLGKASLPHFALIWKLFWAVWAFINKNKGKHLSVYKRYTYGASGLKDISLFLLVIETTLLHSSVNSLFIFKKTYHNKHFYQNNNKMNKNYLQEIYQMIQVKSLKTNFQEIYCWKMWMNEE